MAEPQTIELEIECLDWLEPYRYKAIFITDREMVAGYFAVARYESAGDLWHFTGVFTRE